MTKIGAHLIKLQLSIFRFVRARLTETGGAWGIGCGKSKEIVPGVYAAVTGGVSSISFPF